MRTTSIINLKGGTGKTVTAVNLAYLLNAAGRRVLLIDADPQHNSSDFFLGQYDADGCTTGDLIRDGAGYWENFVTRTAYEDLDIIPSDLSLISCDVASIARGGSQLERLRDFTEVLAADDAYDYCLIDCPPSFTAASVASIMASDDVVIPIKIDAFSLGGLAELNGQIAGLRMAKPDIRIAGALVTMWNASSVCVQGRKRLESYGVPLYKTNIRRAVAVDETTFSHLPLELYKPKSTAACDYRAFASEYVGGDLVG